MSTITFMTKDGESVTAEKEIMTQSVFVKNYLDDNDDDDSELPLPKVNKATLDKVIEFLKYIKDHDAPQIEQPLKDSSMDKVVDDQWFAKYIEVPKDDLLDLVMASHFMDIQSLQDLSAAKVATFLKDKTEDEMRAFWEVTNDLSADELKWIDEENAWAEQAF
eukprot:CAMPEP_0170492268 /NCGR_PEP_ID=MMETSP0208-20121228/11957_1 /TAXON_ID=197538 /ORGANISM="Strombidium inclinatum, Strain S3" /LENGTH=162 /DNA_ID=CAMNT_0010767981 /DNA_START=17 /DNA_END=505 /DNA_ORIENTATION=+